MHTLAVTVTWKKGQMDDMSQSIVESIIALALSSAKNGVAFYRFMQVNLPNDPPCTKRTSWMHTQWVTACPHAQAKRVVETLIKADAVDMAVAQIGDIIVSAGSAGGRKHSRQYFLH